MVTTRGQMDSKRNFYEVDYDPSEQSEQKPKKKQNVSERSSHMEEQVQPITDEDELDYIVELITDIDESLGSKVDSDRKNAVKIKDCHLIIKKHQERNNNG